MDTNKFVGQQADQPVRENRRFSRFAGNVEDVFSGGTDSDVGESNDLASLSRSQKNFQGGDGVMGYRRRHKMKNHGIDEFSPLR